MFEVTVTKKTEEVYVVEYLWRGGDIRDGAEKSTALFLTEKEARDWIDSKPTYCTDFKLFHKRWIDLSKPMKKTREILPDLPGAPYV